MADLLCGVVVDVGAGIAMLAKEVKMRLNMNLAQSAKDAADLVERLAAVVGDVGSDNNTAPTMASAKRKLVEMNEVLQELERLAEPLSPEQAAACGLCGKSGKTTVKKMQQSERALTLEKKIHVLAESLKVDLELLVQAVQLAAHTRRASNVVRSQQVRRFWDNHFGGQRECSPPDLMEALEHECKKLSAEGAFETAMPMLRDVFSARDKVTVLRFDELFGDCPGIVEALQATALRHQASGVIYKLVVIELPTKMEDTDAGGSFLMAKNGDSLKTLRKLIQAHAQSAAEPDSDDEVEDDDCLKNLEFMALGQFHLYLDKGHTRVLKKQESQLVGREYIERACIVRSKSKDFAEEVLFPQAALPGQVKKEEVLVETSAGAEIAAEARKGFASNLSVWKALKDEDCTQTLRQLCAKKGSGEQSVQFLADYYRAEAKGADVLEFAVSRLAEQFLAPNAPMLVPDAPAAARVVIDAGARTEDRIAALGTVAAHLDKTLEPMLATLQKQLSAPPKVVASKAEGKKVVVVGGGYAGLCAAKFLDLTPGIHVTLVTPCEYFEDPIWQPGALASPGSTIDDQESIWPRFVMMYKDQIKHGRVIQQACTAVHESYIECGPESKVVPFDYCMLAMGSAYTSTIKTRNASLEYRWKQMRARHLQLESAKSVLVVGGGLVGVEHATEIAVKWPDLKVTMVQRAGKLLPRIATAHEKVAPVLEEMGIEVILGEEVLEEDSGVMNRFITTSGRTILVDVVYWCCGYKANTESLRNGSPAVAACLDKSGFIMVDDSLRLAAGHGRILAGGDLVEDRMFERFEGCHAERMAASAHKHAHVAAINIVRLAEGRPDELLRIDHSKVLDDGNRYVFVNLGPTKCLVAAPNCPAAMAMLGQFGIPVAELDKDNDGVFVWDDGMAFMANICTMMWGSFKGYDGSEPHMMLGMDLGAPDVVDPSKKEEAAKPEEAANGPDNGSTTSTAVTA